MTRACTYSRTRACEHIHTVSRHDLPFKGEHFHVKHSISSCESISFTYSSLELQMHNYLSRKINKHLFPESQNLHLITSDRKNISITTSSRHPTTLIHSQNSKTSKLSSYHLLRKDMQDQQLLAAAALSQCDVPTLLIRSSQS